MLVVGQNEMLFICYQYILAFCAAAVALEIANRLVFYVEHILIDSELFIIKRTPFL
jgi:hypothetical protein